MLGNYRMAAQLVASRVVLSATELVNETREGYLSEICSCPRRGEKSKINLERKFLRGEIA
jgi:hypothetical protein